MEHVRKCLRGASVTMKEQHCKVTVIAVYFVLSLLLTLAVALYSYAAEGLILGQAVGNAIRNNPWLKAADARIEIADAGVPGPGLAPR